MTPDGPPTIGVPVVDAHHHLYVRSSITYLADDYLADVRTVPEIEASVFVQAGGFYRDGGQDSLRPVGETDQAATMAEAARQRSAMRLCAGIVAFADLTLGENVRDVIEAHIEAGQGRMRGIRHILAWDRDPALLNPAYPTVEDLMDDPTFRAGFAQLHAFDLSFDAWVLFPQLPRLARLARRFPETRIVVNHCGGVLGTAAYAGRRQEVFDIWKAGIATLADCPNVFVKIGGLGMTLSGFSWAAPGERATVETVAAIYRAYLETILNLFGPQRCMFESNFPADRPAYDYATYWQAMAHLVSERTEGERRALFGETARSFYRL